VLLVRYPSNIILGGQIAEVQMEIRFRDGEVENPIWLAQRWFISANRDKLRGPCWKK